MRYLTRHIIIALTFFCTLSISAQSLIDHYEALHGSVKGCRIYHGQLDDIFPLEMLICDDKGAYKMYSSSDIYNLSIETKGDTLEMLEEDSQERTSGYITLSESKNKDGKIYSGEWKHIESSAKYPLIIYEQGLKIPPTPNYLTKLTGIIRSRVVDINIDHTNRTLEIQEKFGLLGRYKSEYICKNDKCTKMVVSPEGIIGVSSVEINKNRNGDYSMIILTADQHRERSELKIVSQVKSKTKSYSDYRSMILAEYAVFGDDDLDEYILKLQLEWIRSTSARLREILKSDPTEIVSDRLKNQATSWLEIELWTEDFISGVQYKQYNWEPEIEATAFAYHIDKSKVVSLTKVWDNNWDLTNLDSTIDNENSTWVVGRSGIYKIYFDRIKGIQRESYPYADLTQHIDGGSWLDKLLERDKIKD